MRAPHLTPERRVTAARGLLVLGWIVGLLARLPGLTTGSGLFRDDAWVAAPSRGSFTHAVGLVSTFPGFSVLLWPWLHLTAPSVLAAQIPALVAGLCTIPALWWMFRRFDTQPLIGAALTVAISLSPVAITYSTRVKPYTTELVLAALLIGVSRARSATAGWWPLALLSVVAFTMSYATAPVILGCWASTLLAPRRDFSRQAIRPLLAVGACCLIVVGATWHRVPPSLRAFWKPFYVDFSSLAGFARSWQHLAGGFSSGLTGAPLLTTTRALTTSCAGGVLLILVAVGVLGIAKSWRELVAPITALASAVVLAALHVVPLGGGRTDQVLYPAVGLLLAAGLERLLMASGRGFQRGLSMGIAGATSLTLVLAVTAHRAQYPVSDLSRALEQSTTGPFATTSVTVIDAPLRYNFAWSGFTELEPAASVRLVATSTNEAGYTVELEPGQPQLFVANADHGDSTYEPQRWVADVSRRLHPGESVAFLSITEQVVNPTTGHLPGQARDPHHSPFFGAFIAAGWKPGSLEVDRGVFVQVLTKPTRSH